MKALYTALFLVFATTAFSQNKNEAKQYLTKAKQAIEKHDNQYLEFEYAMDRPSANGKKTISYDGKLTVAGEKYRLEMNGFEYLSDGKKMYIISHDDEEVTSTDLGESNEAPITPSAILNGFEKGYSYKLAGTEKIGGRTVQYIILKPNVSEEIREITIGIFTDDYTVHSFQRMGLNNVDIRFTVKQSQWNVKLQPNYLTFVASDFSDYTIFD